VFQVFLHLDRFMEEPGALLRTLQLGGYLALFITIASLRLDPRVAVAVARVSIILLPIECVMAWRNRALESYGFLCGTFDGEHNTFAAYLVLMVAMVTAYLQVAARRAVRLALVLLLILAGVSLAFSFSRAAYLAAPVAVLAVFHGSGGRRALLRGVAVIAAALAFAAMFAPADLADRFLSIWDALRSQRADISFGTRLAIWRAAVDDLVRTRFLGVGIIGENIIDNSFVRALVETGFVGLGVHLWLVFSAAAWLRRASRRTPVPEIRAIALGLYGATIALLIVMSLSCDTFLLHRVMGLFWTMFGAVVASSPASAGSSHHDPPPDSPHAAVA
jgi:O-antigen ligase